jgi:hypothetical protein
MGIVYKYQKSYKEERSKMATRAQRKAAKRITTSTP